MSLKGFVRAKGAAAYATTDHEPPRKVPVKCIMSTCQKKNAPEPVVCYSPSSPFSLSFSKRQRGMYDDLPQPTVANAAAAAARRAKVRRTKAAAANSVSSKHKNVQDRTEAVKSLFRAAEDNNASAVAAILTSTTGGRGTGSDAAAWLCMEVDEFGWTPLMVGR